MHITKPFQGFVLDWLKERVIFINPFVNGFLLLNSGHLTAKDSKFEDVVCKVAQYWNVTDDMLKCLDEFAC